MAIWTRIRGFWRDERGLSTVEYALLLTLIVMLAIGAWASFSSTVSGMVGNGVGKVQNAGL